MSDDNVTPFPGGRKPARSEVKPHANVSHQVRMAVLKSFDAIGREKYLIELSKTSPRDYVLLLRECIDPPVQLPPGFQIVIQAAPIPQGAIAGVTNSPIKSHLGAPRQLEHSGEVIDTEPT